MRFVTSAVVIDAAAPPNLFRAAENRNPLPEQLRFAAVQLRLNIRDLPRACTQCAGTFRRVARRLSASRRKSAENTIFASEIEFLSVRNVLSALAFQAVAASGCRKKSGFLLEFIASC